MLGQIFTKSFVDNQYANITSKNDKNDKIEAIILQGDWGYFIPPKKLSILKQQISSYKNDIYIYFQDIKASMILMLFIKDCAKDCGIKNIYVYNCDEVVNFLPFLKSNDYKLFVDNEKFENNKIKMQFESSKIKQPTLWQKTLHSIGQYVFEFVNSFLSWLNFIGLFLYYIFDSIKHPVKIRFNSLIYQMHEHGFKALPISLLTAFIIGYAITLQGAIQLDKLGAALMSVDITAKLSLREMGPFILALLIAGRSSSSFTAQIGSMRLTEELSAMQAMNLNFFHYLVIPRVLALMIVMPLMVFAADAMTLLGGMIAIKSFLGIGFIQYIDKFYDSVSIWHFWIGIIKAPVFGAIIGIIGCFRGLTCDGDTQSIGRFTTISLVNSMFWCIMANAIFSVLFTRLNL